MWLGRAAGASWQARWLGSGGAAGGSAAKLQGVNKAEANSWRQVTGHVAGQVAGQLAWSQLRQLVAALRAPRAGGGAGGQAGRLQRLVSASWRRRLPKHHLAAVVLRTHGGYRMRRRCPGDTGPARMLSAATSMTSQAFESKGVPIRTPLP